MKPRLITFILMALLYWFVGTAFANEASVKKTLQGKFPNAKVDSVVKTPYSGLYEVLMEGNLFYTDEKVKYIFAGNIIEVSTQNNLTGERFRQINKVSFDTLPLEAAVKIVKGNGKRKIAVFSDPDCPYCKKFEEELKSVDNITIYNFLFPIESLHPNATEKAKAVWCAPDKGKAWTDLMHNNVVPENGANCETPLLKIAEVARKLKINGTPTIIFADGRKVPGMIPADKLEQMLPPAGGKPESKPVENK